MRGCFYYVSNALKSCQYEEEPNDQERVEKLEGYF